MAEAAPCYHLWPAGAAEMEDIARQLACYGYPARSHTNFEALMAVCAETSSLGLLVSREGLGTLTSDQRARLRDLAQVTPLVCLADDGGIRERLDAVRQGCRAYFKRPCDLTALLDTLDRLAEQEEKAVGRVLVIDDSAAMAGLHAAYLQEQGFVCDIVTDPVRTLEALEETSPELILLDMYMPGVTGEEVAKVIRQQDRYLSIPIVFLSSESDMGRQREAMSLGGDEFLQKPIQPDHLISAVRSRIVRYRALRTRMTCDSLTGLLNHTAFKERLEAEVRRTARRGGQCSVALIDIDHFKQVNDTHGHPAGDRVIKSLARLMRQRLHSHAVLGRYGGEEFAVALPNTAGPDAWTRIDEIRERFAAIEQQAGGRSFRVTLSAGLVQFNAGETGDALIQAADEALYAAKHGGRNQVRIDKA